MDGKGRIRDHHPVGEQKLRKIMQIIIKFHKKDNIVKIELHEELKIFNRFISWA